MDDETSQSPAETKEGGAKRRGPYFGYLVVTTLVLTSFIPLSLGLSCAGIFYPSVAKALGVGTGTLSFYSTFLWMSAVIVLPLMGRALSKLDARICVSGAIIICALIFVWFSQMTQLWQFYLGAVLMSFPMSMLLFLAPSTLINRWFADRAGFFIGLVMAFTGIGGIVWSSVGGILIQSIGWSGAYLVFACLTIITLPAGIFMISSRPEDKGLQQHGIEAKTNSTVATATEQNGITAKKAFRSSSFYLLLAMCFFLNMGMYLYLMIPSYCATIPAGANLALLGATASSVAMAGQTISKLVLGYVGDKRPYAAAIVAIALGMVGVSLFTLGAASVALIYIAAFTFGFYYGTSNVMMPIFTRRSFGDREYPTIYSRISMVAALSGAVSALIWGSLIDSTGGFTVLFVGVAIFMAATIIVTLILSRKKTSADEKATDVAEKAEVNPPAK